MNKKVYVCMTDKFMSGWGISENKIAKYIIECDNWAQAEQIEEASHRRPDMKYVNININKPYYNPAGYTVTMEHYNSLGDVWTGGRYKTDEDED